MAHRRLKPIDNCCATLDFLLGRFSWKAGAQAAACDRLRPTAPRKPTSRRQRSPIAPAPSCCPAEISLLPRQPLPILGLPIASVAELQLLGRPWRRGVVALAVWSSLQFAPRAIVVHSPRQRRAPVAVAVSAPGSEAADCITPLPSLALARRQPSLGVA